MPGDRYGGRTSLKVIALICLISRIGCSLAWNWASLLALRVLAGFAVGASPVLAPVCIEETAPAEKRGMMVGAFQLHIVLGISSPISAMRSSPAWIWRRSTGM